MVSDRPSASLPSASLEFVRVPLRAIGFRSWPSPFVEVRDGAIKSIKNV
jgi:hypothetical protein